MLEVLGPIRFVDCCSGSLFGARLALSRQVWDVAAAQAAIKRKLSSIGIAPAYRQARGQPSAPSRTKMTHLLTVFIPNRGDHLPVAVEVDTNFATLKQGRARFAASSTQQRGAGRAGGWNAIVG